MTVIMVTESGEQHGLINELPNSVKDHKYEGMEPKIKAEIEKRRKEDSKMVKARYINHRGMHERCDLQYMKYPGDTIKLYHLIPGYTYDLPMGAVKQVNESPGLAQRSDRVDGEKVYAKDQAPLRLHELVPISF